MSELASAFLDLVKTVEALRDPKTGCPWDLKQTPQSLIKYIIEEAYELSEAIQEGNPHSIADELGDYLYQVLIQAQIASENKQFNLVAIIKQLNEKLIRRHPHVFSNEKLQTEEQIKDRWEQIKDRWEQIKTLEKSLKKQESKFFDKARGLPPIQSAQKIGDISTDLRFDWATWEQVTEKVKEEWQELQDEMYATIQDPVKLEHEIGDLLFSVTQLARKLNIDAEKALIKTNQRFIWRFEKAFELSGLSRQDFLKLDQDAKEEFYKLAKSQPTKG